MKQQALRHSYQILLPLAVLCLLSFSAWPAPANYAMQMGKAATSLLLDIAAAGDRLVAVGERGHILYSDDNGNSWVQAIVPTSAMLTRVFFINAKLGWAVGHDGNVLASHDGGINWELQRDGVSAQAQLSLEEAVFAPPLMDVWFADEQRGWAAGAYGTLLHTSNGGRNWLDWSPKVDNPDQLHFNGVIGTADGTLFLASEWGTIFRSSTAGESWKATDSGYEGSFFGLVTNPASRSLFAYGLRGTVYRSTDNGLNWAEVQSKVQGSLFGACATREGRLTFVGSNGTVTRSEDNGESFTVLVQASSLGVYGIAPTTDGHYLLSGEGGSRRLIENTSTARVSP
ncbi:MAG: hypothetical protein IMF06_07100 [Proteobacteria bacterium]|nr:hypothetical protein [Pseudomonadota bacterium]